MKAGMWLYLFDIDGTILHTGGAGFRAIRSTFRDLFDHDVSEETLRQVPFHGRTDPLILRDVFRLAGLEARFSAGDPLPMDRVLERYLALLPGEMKRSERRRLYPGVPELLERLGAEPAVALGLLTGNIEGGARAKLEVFDLNRHFPAGGFGSDSADRREIARIARSRCEEHYQASFAADEVIVVGDTAADVDCARAAGFHAVAVATGNVSAEDLRREGADLVFEDFADVPAVLDTLRRRFPM